jgi:hypothetical protein
LTLYNTRIQKGGALLEEMRQLVRFWHDGRVDDVSQEAVRINILNKTTRARAADILRRTFVPRFVEGTPRNAWKLLRSLESLDAPPPLVRPVYYWISAKSESLIQDFCTEFLFSRVKTLRTEVRVDDVLVWLRAKKCPWSPTVATKVARGLLAAFRDFGILEGKAEKHLSTARLQVPAFAFIAFCLNGMGALGRDLLFHPDWRLFFLDVSDVEHYFLECHQYELIEYHAAGSTVSIAFPYQTVEEYARAVVQGQGSTTRI